MKRIELSVTRVVETILYCPLYTPFRKLPQTTTRHEKHEKHLKAYLRHLSEWGAKCLDIENVNECIPLERTVLCMRGSPDAVCAVDEKLIIIEVKTHYDIEYAKLQAELYAILLLRRYPLTAKKVEIHIVLGNNRVYSYEFTAKRALEVIDKLYQHELLLVRAAMGKKLLPIPGKWCYHCSKTTCPLQVATVHRGVNKIAANRAQKT